MLGVFSGNTPITLSRGFSIETLTGVTPSWKTKLNRSISAMKDGIPRWLQHHYKTCCEKGGHHGKQVSRSKKVDLTSFLFFSFFIFFLILFLYFLFLEQLGLGLIGHAITSSHLMAKSQDRSQDLGEFSRRFENK